VSFDSQPTLSGSLVELRPLRPEDYLDLYAAAADPLIWEQHPARNRHEEAGFREFFAEALASRGALLVTDKEARRAIGSSRFHGYSGERSEVEIGWTFLARSHWGGSYNGELKQLMLRHAFRFVNSVVFFVSPGNIRSQRAMEKIGGVLEPERDAEGRLVYRITASAFAAGLRRPAMSRIDSITVDARHPASLARFWAAALDGYAVRAYGEAEVARLAALGFTPETDPTVMVDGPGPTLCFQKMPGRTQGRNRWHLDLAGASRAAEVERLCALGARVRDVHQGWTTLLDPEDNPFCVLDPRPDRGGEAS
jgi:RimJ/RimL family protein N-acetyltransferase